MPFYISKLRLRLATVDNVPQLAALGLLVGLLAGGVIIGFRGLIDVAQSLFLNGDGTGSYASLPGIQRVALPTLAGLVIGLVWHFLPASARQVGVTHVLGRLAYHQARLPVLNAVIQFFAAGLAIVSGHSVGREGPGIHLGATSGSQLGQWLGLPSNSTRTLVACGVAAAIAAGFNTPLAGVIFAMEVVMMEYTITGFAPVILSSVSATALTRWVYGASPAFAVPALTMGSVLELPVVLGLGVGIGILAALFVRTVERSHHYSSYLPIWLRPTLAGLIVGLCALAFPQIMGVGYDTVSGALLGEMGLGALAGIAIVKLLTTSISIGLGVPGGLIGPTLVIGATAGGAIGLIAAEVLPGNVAPYGFYAMIGMGAMMGATLHAPLAALMALLELTANPNIILPGMLAVIGAGLVNGELFKCKPIYLTLLQSLGLDYRNDPVAQSLRRIGVVKVMNTQFTTAPQLLGLEEAKKIIKTKPEWIVVRGEHGPQSLLPAADLARQLQNPNNAIAAGNDKVVGLLDLLEIPAARQDLAHSHIQASLQDALDTLNQNKVDALYITHKAHSRTPRIYGVLTRKDIEQAYS
ncbi:MAG: chloride channel protein [Gammaproteobacteria bacterium]|nr:chloride channel protein [Gammaproteobacteria bacterium]